MDYDFTAAMEEELDNVEEGRLDWQKVVGDFWTPFEHDLVAAEQKIVQVETPIVEIGEACRQCGRPLVRKFGRFGEFIACSGYPECRYTRPLGIGVPCPRCKVGEVVERPRGGAGAFSDAAPTRRARSPPGTGPPTAPALVARRLSGGRA